MGSNPPDATVITLAGTGMEESQDPLVEAIRAIAALRDAIRRGDSVGVRLSLDLYSHGAGRRGLLSTLAGTVSVEEAVATLAPFWNRAEYTIDAARLISPDQAEIYETISLPDQPRPLRTLTLLRRRGGHWRVVTTTDTPDERFVASLLCPREPLLLDDALPNAILHCDANGVMSELREVDGGRSAALRVGPVQNRDQVNNLELGAALVGTRSLVSIALVPSSHPATRRGQLRWFANATADLAEAVHATHVYLPWCDRVVAPSALRIPSESALVTRFVHVRLGEDWVASRGMSHLMLPELEARTIDWPSAESARTIVECGIEQLTEGVEPWRPRTHVKVGETSCWVDHGRRGPEPGQTYGRFGCLRLAPGRRRRSRP